MPTKPTPITADHAADPAAPARKHGPDQLLGSEISVSNAIAAIEGQMAIQYLLKHNTFKVIDTNHDGLVTAQEIQTFVDNSKQMGMAEAGAMASLLGGTDRIAQQQHVTGRPRRASSRPARTFSSVGSTSLTTRPTARSPGSLSHRRPQDAGTHPPADADRLHRRRPSAVVDHLITRSTRRPEPQLRGSATHSADATSSSPRAAVAKYRGVSLRPSSVSTAIGTPNNSAFPVLYAASTRSRRFNRP